LTIVLKTSDPAAKAILELLGIVVGAVEPAGLKCYPYLGSCSYEVLCCADYSYVRLWEVIQRHPADSLFQGGQIDLGCYKYTI
jgi:hypothetical protein